MSQEALQVEEKAQELFPDIVPQSSSSIETLTSSTETRASSTESLTSSSETLKEIPVLLGLEALDPSFSLTERLDSLDINASLKTEIAEKYLSPFSWPWQKKIIALLGPFMASTLAGYSAGAYALASEPLRAKWDIGETLFNVGMYLFVVGFALTPMILAPISEAHGRYWTFVGSGVVFFLGTLGCAVTDSYAGMMVSRFITSNGAAVFATLTGGVVSDLYRKEDRNTPMAMYSMTIMVGSGLGPLISGSAVDSLGWRWIFYLQVISIGLTTTVLLVLFEETRSNVLLRRKCLALNNPSVKTTTGVLVSFAPATDECLKFEMSMIWRSFAFPLRLLATEPIVFWFSLWITFAWAIMYMQFSSIGIVFRSVYGFNNAQVGFVYAASISGTVIGIALSLLQGTLIRRIYPHKGLSSTPEQRLLSPCMQSILLPIGLVWFFMTARKDIPWLSPAIAIGSCSMGIFSIYLAVFNYLADTYQSYASSALAAQSLCRNLIGGIFPLITARMIGSLTLNGTGGLLGGLGLFLTVIPWLLYFFGPKIRSRSLFAKQIQ
ncbi:drug proton antiporter yhk8 [Fusarium beomiforme]|uniref:Drug proton antiporter yhk8 n=1 Tax=Fusarium beomiforme TaxID=44412 RepID=A0A9P5E0J6_9HYPO|nr:drug proton antiporter yhk8 [Fusarium beomiforme]